MINKTICYFLVPVFISFGLVACVPIEQQGQGASGGVQQTLRYEDHVYDPAVKSVQCYVATGVPDQVLEPPVTALSQQRPIILEFDRLHAGSQRLVAKLIHCNADWTPSGLSETQYLNEFNEFFITDMQSSVNTRVPYMHYRFRVPRVKLSGNYLLQVQEEGGSFLLTQRILVYQNLAVVTAKLGVPAGQGGRFSRQPVEFNVFYPDYPIVNPAMEVKAVLRQNHRWDNAKRIPRPTFVREDQKRLEYVFFEPQEHFLGLSEFRPFDTRSVRFNGIGVSRIDLEKSPVEVFLEQDQSREGQAYSQDPDINGKFIIQNKEYGSGNVNGDYTWVNFELRAPEAPNGSVYIMGGLTNWQLKNEALMKYNQERGAYTGRLQLKQGYYNYYYTFKPANKQTVDASYFEGSHFATENSYDILIYYRPPGSRADLLIGYEEVFFNRR